MPTQLSIRTPGECRVLCLVRVSASGQWIRIIIGREQILSAVDGSRSCAAAIRSRSRTGQFLVPARLVKRLSCGERNT